MKSKVFFIQMLILCFVALAIGLAFYFTDHFPFPNKTNLFLDLFMNKASLICLLVAFVISLIAIIYGRRFSKGHFHRIHKTTHRVDILEKKSLRELIELREGWAAFTQLAAASHEGPPPDWKACLYEIKRVLDDILGQIQRDNASHDLTLMSHIQVQIEYLERQINAWMAHETLNTPLIKGLEPFPEEVNKALSYIDELLAEKSNQVNEEPPSEPLPPRRERKKMKKSHSKSPGPKSHGSNSRKKVKEEATEVPLPPRKVVHLPWWRKLRRGKNQ